MNMKTVDFAQASADSASAYVKAEDVAPIVEALEKLVWHVHYGKFIDASSAATAANQALSNLKAAA